MKIEGEELISLLEEINRQLVASGLNAADEVCYGSEASAKAAGARERSILAIRNAVPERIWYELEAMEKRARVAELRKQAQEIENSIMIMVT